MSDILKQPDIVDITGYVKPSCQERALRELGYIVLGRSATGEVRALATHPQDPAVSAESPDRVVMEW